MSKVYDKKQTEQSKLWLRYVDDIVNGRTDTIHYDAWKQNNARENYRKVLEVIRSHK